MTKKKVKKINDTICVPNAVLYNCDCCVFILRNFFSLAETKRRASSIVSKSHAPQVKINIPDSTGFYSIDFVPRNRKFHAAVIFYFFSVYVNCLIELVHATKGHHQPKCQRFHETQHTVEKVVPFFFCNTIPLSLLCCFMSESSAKINVQRN